VKIRMALETVDGQWRVEVAQQGAQAGYRILRDGRQWHAWTGIAAVEHLLAKEGVSMADLVQVPGPPPVAPVQRPTAR
jgi:hypothetical protein